MNEDLIKISIDGDSRGLVRSANDGAMALKNLGILTGAVNEKIAKAENKIKTAGKALVGIGVATGAAMAANVKAASDLETSMNNVFTIVDRNDKYAKKFTSGILDMSTKYPQKAKELAEGLYDISSSGIEAKDSLAVLGTSARAGSAGLSTTATAARAITAALNAYGLGADQANYVSDILFSTVNKGVLTFEDMAQQMGDWVGTAAAAKVPLADAAAAMATMTLAGLPAAQASTALASSLNSFIKPSEDMVTQVKQLGYETPLAMLSTLGYKGAVEKLIEVTGGAPDKLGKFFDNIRAQTGIMALASNDGKNYAKVFDFINNRQKVAGSSQRAYAEQSKSLSTTMNLLQNSLKAVRIEFGQYLLPVVNFFSLKFKGFVDLVAAIPGPLKMLIALSAAATSIIFTFGGAIMMWKAKGILFASTIKLINMYTKSSLPVVSSMAKLVLTSGMNFARTIPMLGGVVAKLDQYAIGAQMAARGAGMVAAALVIGTIAWTGYRTGIRRVKQEVADFAETAASSMQSKNDIDSIGESYKEAFKKMSSAQQDFDSYEKWGSSFGSKMETEINRFGNAFGMLAGQGNKIENAKTAVTEYNKVLQELSRKQTNITANLGFYANKFGLTEKEVLKLANTLKLDLSTSYDQVAGQQTKNGRALERGVSMYRDGRSAAIGMSDALQQAKGSLQGLNDNTIELTDSQKALQSAMEGIGSMGTAFDDALSARKKSLEDAGDAAEKSAQQLKDGYDKDSGAFGEAVDEKRKSLDKAGDDAVEAAEKQRDAYKEQSDALGEGAKDQKKALDKMGDDAVAAAKERQKGLKDEGDALSTSAADKKKSLDKMGQDAVDSAAVTKEAFSKQAEDVKLSLTEYAVALMNSNQKILDWKKDTVTVAGRTSQGVSDAIASMGTDGVDLMHKMATGTDEEVATMAWSIVQNMGATGRQGAIELEAGMLIAQEKGRQGAAGTRKAIADELGLLGEDVSRIAADYGVRLEAGVKPILDSLGVRIDTTNPAKGWNTSAAMDAFGKLDLDGSKKRASNQLDSSIAANVVGGMLEKRNTSFAGAFGLNKSDRAKPPKAPTAGYKVVNGKLVFSYAEGGASGGLPNAPKDAQLRTHKIIQMAEAETGGEWYIPRAKSKRGKSLRYLEMAAGEFGYRLSPKDDRLEMAAGGFRSAADVPNAPAPAGHAILGMAESAVYKNAHDVVANWVTDARAEEQGREVAAIMDALARSVASSFSGVFDNGGTLRAGMNTVYNGTGSPERLIRSDAPGASSGEISINMPLHLSVVGNGDAAIAEVVRKELVPAIERQTDKVSKILTNRGKALTR